nr:MAG TPA: hypothetical protein [Caudoviricetes sp.]
MLFSRSFLYALILINLFIDVKKFANFLNEILKGGQEKWQMQTLKCLIH